MNPAKAAEAKQPALEGLEHAHETHAKLEEFLAKRAADATAAQRGTDTWTQRDNVLAKRWINSSSPMRRQWAQAWMESRQGWRRGTRLSGRRRQRLRIGSQVVNVLGRPAFGGRGGHCRARLAEAHLVLILPRVVVREQARVPVDIAGRRADGPSIISWQR